MVWIWALKQHSRFFISNVADNFRNVTKNSSIAILPGLPCICRSSLIPGCLNHGLCVLISYALMCTLCALMCTLYVHVCTLYAICLIDTILCIFLVSIVQLCLENSEQRKSLRKIQPLSYSLSCNSTQWKLVGLFENRYRVPTQLFIILQSTKPWAISSSRSEWRIPRAPSVQRRMFVTRIPIPHHPFNRVGLYRWTVASNRHVEDTSRSRGYQEASDPI